MFVVITGGSSRTGLELVKYFLSENFTVFTNYHTNSQNLDELKVQFNENLQYKQADLSDKNSLKNFVSEIKSKNQNIDILINTFGDYLQKEITNCSTEDFNYMLNSNLLYVDFLIKSFDDIFSNNATIINFGYSHADKIVADTKNTYYHIAKMGLILLTKAYAKSLGKRGISVNMISPGFLENSIILPEDIQKSIPMNRLAKFEEIISCVDYLIKNRYVSGNNIIVSGGYNI